MTDADVKAIAARSDLVAGVTAILTLRGTVTVQSQAKTLTVLGVMANYADGPQEHAHPPGALPRRGRLPASGRASCVVNRDLYEQLFANDESPDKTIRTLGTTFQVVGEFEEPVDTLGRGDVVPETILIPITVAWYYTPVRQIKTLFAEVRDFEALPAAVTTVEEILRERHRPGSVYEVESMTTVVRLARAISVGLIVVFILAAAVSVVVGRRRHHEHPARLGRAAHARDRRAHVGRRAPPRHPRPVPLRGARARHGGVLDRRAGRAWAFRISRALFVRGVDVHVSVWSAVLGLRVFLRGGGGLRRRAGLPRLESRTLRRRFTMNNRFSPAPRISSASRRPARARPVPATGGPDAAKAAELALEHAPAACGRASRARGRRGLRGSGRGRLPSLGVGHDDAGLHVRPAGPRGRPRARRSPACEIRQLIYDPNRRSEALQAEASGLRSSRPSSSVPARQTVETAVDCLRAAWVDRRSSTTAHRRMDAAEASRRRTEAAFDEGRRTELDVERAKLQAARANRSS